VKRGFNLKVLLVNRDYALKSPRSIRMFNWLKKEGCDVRILTFGDIPSEDPNICVVSCRKSLFINQLKRLIFKFLGMHGYVLCRSEDKDFIKHLKQEKPEIIICQTLDLLPYVMEYQADAKIVFDAREYYPEQGSDRWIWRILFKKLNIYICRKYLPKCDAIITVSQSIASLYKENFGADCFVCPSMAEFYGLLPSAVDASRIKMIHHGSCARSRKLENMIDLIGCLSERFSLTFMLLNDDPEYLSELRDYAHKKGVGQRVHFISSVSYKEIVPTLNRYDIGIYMLSPENQNQLYALPNKFFEYIQARLMLVVTPNPDMAEYVSKYGLGIVGEDFSPRRLAINLESLSSNDILFFKNKSQESAKILSAENDVFRPFFDYISKKTK